MFTLGLSTVESESAPARERETLFASAFLDQRCRPYRGLLYSFLVHEIIIFGALFLSLHGVAERAHLREEAVAIHRREQWDLTYLPILAPAPRLDRSGESTSAVPAASREGLSYPGPQLIVSDFPDPDNRFQTVLAPALIRPPVLEPLSALPNVVRLANAGPVQPVEARNPGLRPPEAVTPAQQQPVDAADAASDVRTSEPSLPAILVEAPVSVDMPALVARSAVAFARDPELQAALPALRPLEPTLESPETRIPAPEIEFSSVQTSGPDLQNLLSLTPAPAAGGPVPPGEMRGRFAISPEPNLDAAGTEPGSRGETANRRAGEFPAASGGTATASSAGSAGAAASAGAGAGGSAASGPGVVPGTGESGGVDSVAVPAANPFPGITITGGETGLSPLAGGSRSADAGIPLPPQTSYGVTIMATEDSGGGLPSFGVFVNAQVSTVYIDMRRTTRDRAPSWTLQYAVPAGVVARSSVPSGPVGTRQDLVPPFPVVKQQPALPPNLVRHHLGRMVIVYAIINTAGRMEEMLVKESPDALFNAPILNALNRWTFRPAELHGEAVPIKILLGIPIWLSE